MTDHALGAITNCDTYVYSFGYDDLVVKINNLIDAYDSALAQLLDAPGASREATIERLTENTPQSLRAIKWTHTLKKSLKNGEVIEFDESRIREVHYRPFTRLWLYEDHRILSQAKATSDRFPRLDSAGSGGGGGGEFICLASPTNRAVFGAIATDCLADLCALGTNQPARVIPRKRS